MHDSISMLAERGCGVDEILLCRKSLWAAIEEADDCIDSLIEGFEGVCEGLDGGVVCFCDLGGGVGFFCKGGVAGEDCYCEVGFEEIGYDCGSERAVGLGLLLVLVRRRMG